MEQIQPKWEIIPNDYYINKEYTDGYGSPTFIVKLKDYRVFISSSTNSIDFTFYLGLYGDFYLPENTILMDVRSSRFSINDVPLMFLKIIDDYVTPSCVLFKASVSIPINKLNIKDLNLVHEKWDWNFVLKLDHSKIKNTVIEKKFSEMYKMFSTEFNNLPRLNYYTYITNQYQIKDLDVSNINTKYKKEDYINNNVLPNDFFINIDQKEIFYPNYFFEKNNINYNFDQPIKGLYKKTNAKYRHLSNIEVILKYQTIFDTKVKEIVLPSNLIQADNLHFMLKSDWNYKTNQLTVVNLYGYGVEGIYFPVPTKGTFEVKLTQSSPYPATYLDTIKFQTNGYLLGPEGKFKINSHAVINSNEIEWKEI